MIGWLICLNAHSKAVSYLLIMRYFVSIFNNGIEWREKWIHAFPKYINTNWTQAVLCRFELGSLILSSALLAFSLRRYFYDISFCRYKLLFWDNCSCKLIDSLLPFYTIVNEYDHHRTCSSTRLLRLLFTTWLSQV